MTRAWITPSLAVVVAIVIVMLLTMLPLMRSSLYWTMNSEVASKFSWWASRSAKWLYVVMVILVAYVRPNRVTVLRTSVMLIASLIVFVAVPFVVASTIGFWRIRPDSWDLLRWRLADDWRDGSMFRYLGRSIGWLIVTASLWLWAGWRDERLESRSLKDVSVTSGYRQTITIQRLMTLTALAAALIAILRWLKWEASRQDFLSIVNASIIAFSIAGIGQLFQRGEIASSKAGSGGAELGSGHWVRPWTTAAVLLAITWISWFALQLFQQWMFERQPRTRPLPNFMQPSWADQALTASLATLSSGVTALLGWGWFAIWGYRVNRPRR